MIRHDFEECLKRGKIKQFPEAVKLVSCELSSAENDLKTADRSLKNKDYKWATI